MRKFGIAGTNEKPSNRLERKSRKPPPAPLTAALEILDGRETNGSCWGWKLGLRHAGQELYNRGTFPWNEPADNCSWRGAPPQHTHRFSFPSSSDGRLTSFVSSSMISVADKRRAFSAAVFEPVASEFDFDPLLFFVVSGVAVFSLSAALLASTSFPAAASVPAPLASLLPWPSLVSVAPAAITASDGGGLTALGREAVPLMGSVSSSSSSESPKSMSSLYFLRGAPVFLPDRRLA